ncbi:MAG: hypothetical protein QW587_04945 [Candidatus Bathyarchaeia archaeon]
MDAAEMIELLGDVAPSLVKLLGRLKRDRREVTDGQLLVLISAATFEELQRNNALLQKHCEDTARAIAEFQETASTLMIRTRRLQS